MNKESKFIETLENKTDFKKLLYGSSPHFRY